MIRKAIVIVLCVVFLFPIYMMFSGSVSNYLKFIPYPPKLWPHQPTLDGYRFAFNQEHLPRWALNTVFVFVGYVSLGILVNGLTGYALSFFRFKGKAVVFWIFMSSVILSRMSLLISQYVVGSRLHLPGFIAVFAMTTFWPAGIYIFKNYFDSIPRSMIECARMDGANSILAFWHVVLPLSPPVLGFALLSKGLEALGDFVWQLLCLPGDREKTMLVGLIQMVRTRSGNQNVAVISVNRELAAGCLLLIPMLVLFASSNKYFIKGIMTGAMKE